MTCPCDFPVEHLIAYAEDTLPQGLRRSVTTHVRTCAACRQRLDACKEMIRMARTAHGGGQYASYARLDEWLRSEIQRRALRLARQRRLRLLIPIALPLKCLLLAIALRPRYGTVVRFSAGVAAAFITAVVLRQALTGA